MTPTEISLIISVATLLLSAATSAFIAGSRWGRVNGKLDGLEHGQRDRATKADLHALTERLARIEGMFELRIKDDRAA